MNKTAGIALDNYKIPEYKKELISSGFTEFTVVPFTYNTSTIKVVTDEGRIEELAQLCHKLETFFKTRKN